MVLSMPGKALGFSMKILKHVDVGDHYRVKDYICGAYDDFEPSPCKVKNHPCYEILKEGIDFMKKNSWQVGIEKWKDQGYQIVCISPNGDYYRSKFKH